MHTEHKKVVLIRTAGRVSAWRVVETDKGKHDAHDTKIVILPPEFFDIWTLGEREWARQLYASEHFAKVKAEYIDIESQLRDEPRGPRRTRLVEEAFDLRRFDREP